MLIITTEKHNKFDNTWVVVGKEDDGPDRFFTRMVDEDGQSYWGHYCMTLQEAVKDLEKRKG